MLQRLCNVPRHSARIFRCSMSTFLGSKEAREIFSDPRTAKFIAGADSASQIPESKYGLPEVVVLGRANVGKSSLLNTVLGRNSLASSGKKAGHTKQLNFYCVGPEPGALILVDSPGYGARGRPEWGDMLEEYLRTRQQLRQVYLLINGEHGLKDSDKAMLERLSSILLTPHGTHAWTLQPIITKADRITMGGKVSTKDVHKRFDDIRTEIRFGIEILRENMIDACGLRK